MAAMGSRNVLVPSLSTRWDKNKKLGFDKCAYDGDVFSGVPNRIKLGIADSDGTLDDLIKITDFKLDKLAEYDARIHVGLSRKQYIETVISKYHCNGYVALKQGKPVGYICEIPAESYRCVGPLYAENKTVARILLSVFVSDMKDNEKILTLTPRPNYGGPDDVSVFQEFGLGKVGEYKNLFNREVILIPFDKVYAISSSINWLC